MFDLDFFKQFNDTYGHLVGDECLRKVARIAEQAICRPRDISARYGGEEFATILPDTDAEGAMSIAKKLCDRIEDLKIPHALSSVSNYVTISVGVATSLVQQNDYCERMIANADRALYQAKRQGRNCAIAHTDLGFSIH